MSIFVTKEVISRAVEQYRDLLEEKCDKINDQIGDQADQKNQRVTLSHTVNLSVKSPTATEVVDHLNFIIQPSIPAQKEKGKRKSIVDTVQGVIEFPENGGEDEEGQGE
jgi:hypothetical protein